MIALITSGSCDDPSDRGSTRHRREVIQPPTIAASHRESRLCLLIRQVFIPIFEVPFKAPLDL
ncbi:hypothetical protein AVEN_7998-1, partial [Araneus ventricosus]